MKFRLLTNEELSHFEDDLKQFLIVHGVHGEEWAELNKSNPDKAIQLVGIFSDMVLQKVYEKIEFLEFRTVDSCLVFHCLPEKMELISIQRIEDSNADLSTAESIHEILSTKPQELSFFRSEKLYNQERELEVHRFIEQGCIVSNRAFWDALILVISA